MKAQLSTALGSIVAVIVSRADEIEQWLRITASVVAITAGVVSIGFMFRKKKPAQDL